MGRPTKCTPELTAEFAKHMQGGLYLEEACALVGVTPNSVRAWKRRGEEALDAAGDDLDAVPEEEQPFAAFLRASARAEAAAIARAALQIQQAAAGPVEGDWRAAAWFLERRRPDTWGLRKTEARTEVAAGAPTDEEGRPVSWWDVVRAASEERLAEEVGAGPEATE